MQSPEFSQHLRGICVDVPRNGGIFKDTPKGKMSLIVKPLSAITESPSLNGRSSMPDLSTISLCDILPVYSWLINVIAPDGEIPTSPFNVV